LELFSLEEKAALLPGGLFVCVNAAEWSCDGAHATEFSTLDPQRGSFLEWDAEIAQPLSRFAG